MPLHLIAGASISEQTPLPVGSIPATLTTASVSVGSASTPVVAANNNRRYLLLTNDSDTTIYIALGNNAAQASGIRLAANGGQMEFSAVKGNLYTGAVTAISSASGKNLLVLEGV